MNKAILPALFALLLPLKAQETGLLPNSSFEKSFEGRPKGWRLFTTPPEVKGDYYVTDGKEGEDTHSGRNALQFLFPDGAELAQCVWMADPVHAGIAVEPGRYSCSFWIKSQDLAEEAHVWIAITGYGADNSRTGELARSDYLRNKHLPAGDWTKIRFSFEIPDGVSRVGLSVIFKTNPNASINPVTPATRVLVDDIEILRE